ncbi:endonuclease VIII [Clostridium sp. D2Q-14]|uniref:endonuclease VIII n=1 Tax=Anaeromonas gelatinilytica TaxID=2683194 RepID=UPI00193BBF98|nr:endonuclease VIII [Anaeromonas gelatinilytica]MBS4535318.1 endonuclease VIII [Anaeromonas gelatinilytica]
MIEIPEAIVLSHQIIETLHGKRIEDVIVNQTPHKFAWFFGDHRDYNSKLNSKIIEKTHAYGGFIEIILGDTKLLLGEGISLRYFIKGEKLPQRHQLLIQFDDKSVLVATIQMYGGIWCFEGEEFDNIYYQLAKEKPSPLSEEFDFKYYKNIILDESLQKKSVKAVLATEQRIPGLGNGVLQDILFNAKVHPKRKVITLSDEEIERLYHAIKFTLREMVINGGRDTEKDLFGCSGGYVTKLSRKTLKEPCMACGGNIIKKAYMGGSIYYCEGCQIE